MTEKPRAHEVRHGFAEAPTNDTRVRLAYEDWGDPSGETVLLIMGLGAQLTFWPELFCETLVDAGYRVVRFDNRDVGLSTKLPGCEAPGPRWMRILRCQLGLSSPARYTLEDMASDAEGVLDALGIDRAHIVGASMGGMIAQVFAGTRPERTRSLGLLFTTAVQRFFAPPTPATLAKLRENPHPDATLEERIEFKVRTMAHSAGNRYPYPEDELREAIASSFRRCEDSTGLLRQLDAICGSGDLRRYHSGITAPVAVIHGSDDPLIPCRNGHALAKWIPGATLTVFDGMGHSLPPALLPNIAQVLLANFERAAAATAAPV
ncbi:alpha/beta fold hydrolase [Segniliparus rotundus]|nr:alpha/beta hydrolase [Segniliparus rotundus]